MLYFSPNFCSCSLRLTCPVWYLQELDLITIETAIDFKMYVCSFYEVQRSKISELGVGKGAKVIDTCHFRTNLLNIRTSTIFFVFVYLFIRPKAYIAARKLLGLA